MSDISNLQSKIEYLEKENAYLKDLLTQAGISYEKEAHETLKGKYDANQGTRIIKKEEITAEDANQFFSMFWGRTDLYSQRTIKKATGEVNYYPQCSKFWKNGCLIYHGKIKHCGMCDSPAFRKLGKDQIINHLLGKRIDSTDVIGVYPLLPDDTCRFIVFDFDNHEKGAEKIEFANLDEAWKEEVDSLREICEMNGIDALVERSRSGSAAHVWIFFQNKIDASLARKFGNALLRKGAETVNLKSFRFYDRMLPMQDHMPKGGFGNLIALPLQGQALKDGNSAFVDADWNAYPDQWKALLSKEKITKEFIEDKIKEWQLENPLTNVEKNEVLKETGEKPWDKSKCFHMEDVNGTMNVILADAIYVLAHEIDELGFDEWFYSSLLVEDKEHFSYRRTGGNRLFRKGKSEVLLGDFLEWIIYSTDSLSMDIYDLSEYLSNEYNITLNTFKIVETVTGSTLYYDRITEKVYADYDVYFAEI